MFFQQYKATQAFIEFEYKNIKRKCSALYDKQPNTLQEISICILFQACLHLKDSKIKIKNPLSSQCCFFEVEWPIT